MTTRQDGRTDVVSIGIARFADDERRTIPFAASDARAFAEGWPAATADTRVLTDAEATTSAIGETLGEVLQARAADRLVVFIASRAIRGDGDLQLLTHDGAVLLGEILRPLWNASAGSVVVLLDLLRGSETDERIASDELAALFPASAARTLVLADDGRNGSHVSGELHAGIWAAHVTEAFSGTAPRARRDDRTLTAGSLRAFLAAETARSLSRAYTDGRRQTPVVLSASDEDVLADPVAVAGPDRSAPPLAGLLFFTEVEIPVKALGGFRKSLHSVPSDTLASSRAWVARLAEPDLAREIEETVARLRRCLGYKRRDLRADGPQDGAASVLTPDFAFHIVAEQHPVRPGQAVVRRSLDKIANLDVLGRSGFGDAFPHGFASLHVPGTRPVDLAMLIDGLEELEPPVIENIEYPTDLSRLELQLSGFDGRVRVERDGLTINAAGPVSPADLGARFATVRDILASLRTAYDGRN